MKKILLSVVLVVMVLLTACYEGVIDSKTTITSEQGAGTKTISLKIYRDTAEVPGKPGQQVGNNSKYLPKGLDGLVEKLKKECKLEGVVFKTDTSHQDYDVITLSYDFKDIADYNAKLKKLANGAPVEDAQITVEGGKITFKEATKNFESSVQWAIDAVYDDPEVFDPRQGDPNATPIEKKDMAKLFDLVVTLENATAKVDFAEARLNYEDPPEYITVTGTLGSTAGASPKTGDMGIVIPLLGAISAGAVVLAFQKKRKA